MFLETSLKILRRLKSYLHFLHLNPTGEVRDLRAGSARRSIMAGLSKSRDSVTGPMSKYFDRCDRLHETAA